MKIRRLTVSDVAAYMALRLRALKDCPTAFGASYAEEKNRPASAYEERLRTSRTSLTFGAFDGTVLVGVATLVRETRQKERHKTNIYGMYVAPEARRQGLGRRLIETCLDRSRRLRGVRQVRLSVSALNEPARRLYLGLGFVEYGCEIDALKVGSDYYDELFLVRRVR